MTNLAMNFYLKTADAEGRGFEFTPRKIGRMLGERGSRTAHYSSPSLLNEPSDLAQQG